MYFLVGMLMFITISGIPYGRCANQQGLIVVFIIQKYGVLINCIFHSPGMLCWKLSCYFLWPFGKSIHEVLFRFSWCLGCFSCCFVSHFCKENLLVSSLFLNDLWSWMQRFCCYWKALQVLLGANWLSAFKQRLSCQSNILYTPWNYLLSLNFCPKIVSQQTFLL